MSVFQLSKFKMVKIKLILALFSLAAVSTGDMPERHIWLDVGEDYQITFDCGKRNFLDRTAYFTDKYPVTYYADADYLGMHYTAELSRRRCHYVDVAFRGYSGISSFHLNNNCVRAYESHDCTGDSIIIIPGVCDNQPTEECLNDKITSMRIC